LDQELDQVDVEEIMLKRRGYVEEKRVCGREEVFNMPLVSVKMAENRVVSVSSTMRTRQHQLSIQ
jgi:hypothetical protein